MIRRIQLCFFFLVGILGSRIATAETFRFTAATDTHEYPGFTITLQAMKDFAGGPGAFFLTTGDVGAIPSTGTRAMIDSVLGSQTVWFNATGNHDAESYTGIGTMPWMRAEYHTGNGLRTPFLKMYTNQDGPSGSRETCYSFDWGPARFIVLNIYWNGKLSVGSDDARGWSTGNIIPDIYNWLADKLKHNTKPYVFVMGHEPAFPYNDNIGDSLDQYPENRDRFWSLLEQYHVTAYLCGHTHVYSKHRGDKNHVGKVWQVDMGTSRGGYYTFLNITLDEEKAQMDVWMNPGSGFCITDTIIQPRSVFTVSPSRIESSSLTGSNEIAEIPIRLRYSGGKTVSWRVEENSPWLTVSPASGVISGEPIQLTASLNPAGVAHGNYFSTVSIVSDELLDSPQTVELLYHVYEILEVPGEYSTIQGAIDASLDFDTIRVAAGTYPENLQIKGKNITLQSTAPDDWDTVEATVIQGNGTGSVVTFTGTETADCLLEGVSITGGNGALVGGGIHGNYQNPTHATIRNCIIRNNRADWCGGIGGCDGLIESCRIQQNYANAGGGGIGACHGTVRNCLIVNNSAEQSGGGADNCQGEIVNCTIADNIVLYPASGAKAGGGIHYCKNSTIVNCIVWNNSENQIVNGPLPLYSSLPAGSAGGLGCIFGDPRFADSPHGDYHLKSEGWRWSLERKVWTWDSITSRCIDHGHPGMGLAGEPTAVPDDPENEWGINSRMDMGAYGGASEASIPPFHWALAADLDNNGRVDLKDFGLMGGPWLRFEIPNPGDITWDGEVEAEDGELFTGEWFHQTSWYMP